MPIEPATRLSGVSEPSASTIEAPDRSGRIKRLMSERVLKALEGELAENEELKSCFFCQKYVNLLVAFLGLIPYLLMAVPFYVAANEGRVFVLKGSRLSNRINLLFSDDLDHFEVKRRKGLFNDKVIVRCAGRDVYKLRVARNFRNEVDVLLELLGASAA
jgi:hypothetical protein